ncbi:MAG: hypothetical protein ACEPOV_02375 [Hyphomicrobiales bacterium]
MNFTQEEWKSLAENVHFGGYEYYIHKLNRVIIEVPSEELLNCDEDLNMRNERKNYEDIHELFERIQPMTNEGLFELIEEFVFELPESNDKYRLEELIKGTYAFTNFNSEIKRLGVYDKWKDYKKQKQIRWVQNEVNRIFEPEEDLL